MAEISEYRKTEIAGVVFSIASSIEDRMSVDPEDDANRFWDTLGDYSRHLTDAETLLMYHEGVDTLRDWFANPGRYSNI